MSIAQGSRPAGACPLTGDALPQLIHQRLDEIIAFCREDRGPTSFLDFESALLGLLQSLGCLLIRLFLQARHRQLDLTPWTRTQGYRVADAAADVMCTRTSSRVAIMPSGSCTPHCSSRMNSCGSR